MYIIIFLCRLKVFKIINYLFSFEIFVFKNRGFGYAKKQTYKTKKNGNHAHTVLK